MNKKVGYLVIRPIPVEQTHPLRQAILRPGYPPGTCIYPGDEDLLALHAGAFIEYALVGIASVYPQEPPFATEKPAWRLRGMAVKPEARHKGYGRMLVHFCLDHIKQQNGKILWCNGRTTAAPFYESLGFTTYGEEFDIPESGPHYIMWRPI